MDRKRVMQEIDALQDSYPSVKWSFKKNYVMITKFGYPEGWQPRTAPLFFSLPPNYPRRRPDAYIPPDMRYEGETAWAQHDRNDDGWWKWCIPRMDWKPENHSLATMVEVMKVTLSQPNERNPYNASRQRNLRDWLQEMAGDRDDRGEEARGDPFDVAFGGDDDGGFSIL